MSSSTTFARVSRVASRMYGRLFSANPYPLYKFLRTRYPLLRTPIGFWISTRYDNCLDVLRDKRFLAFDLNALDAFPPDDGLKSMREALQHAIVFRNPPDHTRLRRLMTTFFSPAVVNGLEPRIQHIVDYLLDAVEARGSMDLIKDVAFPFPIDVLAEVMGADDSDKPMFRDWMRTLGVPLDPVISANDPGVEVRHAIADVRRYFSDLAADRRKHPREDLISIMVAAENRGDLQTEEELVFSAMFTLLAGHETTMNMIGNGMLALFRNPDALARLRSDPSLIESALDEFLRFDSPVQVTFRTASEDIELAGRTIPRGEHVVVSFRRGKSGSCAVRKSRPARHRTDGEPSPVICRRTPSMHRRSARQGRRPHRIRNDSPPDAEAGARRPEPKMAPRNEPARSRVVTADVLKMPGTGFRLMTQSKVVRRAQLCD